MANLAPENAEDNPKRVSQFGLGLALGLPSGVGLGLVGGAILGEPAYGLLIGSIAGVSGGVTLGLVLENRHKSKAEGES